MYTFKKGISFGLTAACFSIMLFMSSCSKEDTHAPQPEIAINENSNQKANLIGSGYGITPFGIPPTVGQPGLGSLPSGYTISNAPDVSKIAGLSNSRFLFGNISTPWIPESNNAPKDAGTFLTLGSIKNKPTSVHVEIKKLSPGKKYKFTYYISTMAVKYSSGPGQTPYAWGIVESFSSYINSESILFHNFTGKENQWIDRSFEFTSDGSTGKLNIGLHGKSSAISYGNIFIPEKAIQEVN